ncbi:wall-associated receptor kinase 2-like [Prunus yedoensis var. nudiflora]|uniref:Wall-associated receptor kinase 2-like n=1 Tax=Prunus yedoensis var. nudiflora TaxID=2094558 RepID=A0A314XFJ0_PRUYE|nr:wall-associated receptor kinase 2-like [Prunus yedoensis var. nudiflora]
MMLVLLLAATNAVAAATTRRSAREGGADDGKAGGLMAKPNCTAKCGNIEIPYPFGIGLGCYFGPRFEITCNQSTKELRLMETRMLVDSISLTEGHLQTKQLVNRDCYDAQGKPRGEDQSSGGLSVIPPYTISSDKNSFFVVGCDTYAHFVGRRGNQSYTTGCISVCKNNPNLYADSFDKNESCSGMGCCKTNISPLLDNLSLQVKSYKNHTEVHDFNACGYAFVVKKDNFKFGKTSFQYLNKTHRLPLVLDWQIGEESCQYAMQNKTTYACKGNNSDCQDKPSSGYICLCKPGFQGNPYLPDSCEDIDECALNSTLCNHGKCENKEGNYTCVCDSGYKNLDDITCIKVPSAKPLKISLVTYELELAIYI